MDAAYLQKNVADALSEGLASMSVALPDDKVEYLGRYLIEYKKRRGQWQTKAEQFNVAEESGLNAERDAEVKNALLAKEIDEATAKEAKIQQFIESLIVKTKSKQEALDAVCAFIPEYFGVASTYVALRKATGDSETLHYFGASPNQQHVVGKKLSKPQEEGEEAPKRQGLSFDAFKIPEVAEEELEEGAPPKPAPKPQPLIVDNVMRESRCKFFGIPKLGSYVAIPLSYSSLDHETGCTAGPDDPNTLVANKITQLVILGVDTIGKYRRFKPEEIVKFTRIGEALVSLLEVLEGRMYEGHVAFLQAHKAVMGTLNTVISSATEAEAAAVASVAQALTVDPSIDPPPEPAAESLKPHKESEAAVKTWSVLVSRAPTTTALLALEGHILPAAQSAANLLYACAVVAGASPAVVRDVCGDVSWESVRKNALAGLPSSIANFDCTRRQTVSRDGSIAVLKSFCESNNLYDASTFPAHLPALAVMSAWLQRAVAARDAAVTYYREVMKSNLETIV